MTESQDTATKLRNEIQGAKRYRHDFILRKFGFATGLLGIGSLSTTLPDGTQINFIPLLYLVPLIAIAFDSYILVEDYRIKRAGEFIRRKQCSAADTEVEWENFAHEYPNKGSNIAFFFVTVLYLFGAASVIFQTSPNALLFVTWIILVMSFEIILLVIAFYLRDYLEGNKHDSPNNVN